MPDANAPSVKRVIRIRLSISNAYLIPKPDPVLIDSGVPGDLRRLLKAIRRHGVQPEELRWILHTHGHSDHCGCTKELIRISGARTAIHKEEAERVKAGHHDEIRARDWMARAMHYYLDPNFPPFEIDRSFDQSDDGTSLEEFGLAGTVFHTPGHTSGSVSFVLANGDALIGDLFRGSIWRPNYPCLPFFYDDRDDVFRSIGRLLDTDARRFLPGHFGTISRSAVEKRFDR